MKPTIAIVGVGLIGGSLGQALRHKGYRVIGIGRRRSSLQAAKKVGAVDSYSTGWHAVRDADGVVLCAPVGTLISLAKKILPHMKRGAWLTDAGSVKKSFVQAIGPLAKRQGVLFCGSHPLAGSHQTGVKASRADLFNKAVCVIVPAQDRTLKPIFRFWKEVGACPLIMTAEAHDKALALTSHLPHLIAHALVQSVMPRADRASLKHLMAGSFRDVTRVASSDPNQWAQIFDANAKEVRRAASIFSKVFARLTAQVGRPSITVSLSRSQRFRRPLFASPS